MKNYLHQIEDHLYNNLLPFWTSRIVEPNFGGFQTNYDSDGNRTEVTQKTLLCQARSIFTLSHCIRHGCKWAESSQMILQGIEFVNQYFFDESFGGYYWIVSEDGKVIDDNKVIYGHSFLLYAFSEYAIMSGNKKIYEQACDLFDLIENKASDIENRGYYEHFKRDFKLNVSDKSGVILKSLDVHMHLMESFTNLYEMTGDIKHRKAVEKIVGIIFDHMIDLKSGVGISMFTKDWQSVNNIELNTVWGDDRFDESGKPADVTSFGHNIELAWLYIHTLRILENPIESQLKRLLPIFKHTEKYGIDFKNGGLFVEGTSSGEVVDDDKEFWQQAEAMVGFLDAYLITKETKYLEAYKRIHEFVFKFFVHPKLGEWYCLLDSEGKIKRDYLGSNWKICYHTLRAMTLVLEKLKIIVNE